MATTTTSFDSIGAATQIRDFWINDINTVTPTTPTVPGAWADPIGTGWNDPGVGGINVVDDYIGNPILRPRMLENPNPNTITTAKQAKLKTFKGASTNRTIFDENYTIQPANNSSWQRCMNGAGVYKNNWYLMIPNSNYAFVLFGPWEADATLKNMAYLIPAVKSSIYYGGFQYLQTIPVEFVTAFKSANATVPRNTYQEGLTSATSDAFLYQPKSWTDFTQTMQSVTYKFNFWGAKSKAVQPTLLGLFSFIVKYYVGETITPYPVSDTIANRQINRTY